MSVTEAPALPVLGPLMLVAIAVTLWSLRRRDRFALLQAAVGVVTCAYAAFLLSQVLFPFAIDRGPHQSWRVWLHLTPLSDVASDPVGIVLNVALFVPLGFLLPLIVRVESARRAVLYGFLVSLCIEVVQFVADVTVNTGRIADVDDLIGNSAGTLIGYAAFRLVLMVPAAARLAVAAAWPRERVAPVRTSP